MSDDRSRRENKGGNAALMGAVGAGLEGFSQWYDRERQFQALELRQRRLEELQRQELAQGDRRLDITEGLANKAAARADAMSLTEKKNAFIQDVDSWKSQYIGKDEKSKLRAEAWKQAFDEGFLLLDDKDAKVMADRIAGSFGGAGTAGGAPVISADEMLAGLDQLRARRSARGLSVEDMPDDVISGMIGGYSLMGGAGGGAGGPGMPDPVVEDPEVAAAAAAEEVAAGGPMYPRISRALYGVGNEGELHKDLSALMGPVVDPVLSGVDAVKKKYKEEGLFGVFSPSYHEIPTDPRDNDRLKLQPFDAPFSLFKTP
jgi:hypothetical protein